MSGNRVFSLDSLMHNTYGEIWSHLVSRTNPTTPAVGLTVKDGL